MAKNIMVNEGSSLKIVKNVSKLATKLQDNSEQLWIPEDEIKLVPKTIIQDGTYVANREIGNPYGYSEVTVSGVGDLIIGDTARKTFNQNGVYYANEDLYGPFYGYSEVTVNVDSYSGGSGGQPTSGTVGKDTDGDDAMVVVNPDTGKLEVEKIPVRIEVVTLPYNPYVTYNNGQTIEKDGMVVMAYNGNDEEWGEVPLDEITMEPTVADYSSQSGSHTSGRDVGDRIVYHSSSTVLEVYGGSNNIEAIFFSAIVGNVYWPNCMLVSNMPETITVTSTGLPIQTGSQYTFTYHEPTGYYYASIDFAGSELTNIYGWIEVNNDQGENAIEKLVPLYEGGHAPKYGQNITVQWPRPGDKKRLSDVFEILVAPSPSGTDS